MPASDDEALRTKARERLEAKREFSEHVVTYVVVNALILVIWAFVAGRGFFWPMFPLLGWGLGLVMHGWKVYRGEPTEAEIDREVARLRR